MEILFLQEHRELNALIMRRFCHEGDVELARLLVAKVKQYIHKL